MSQHAEVFRANFIVYVEGFFESDGGDVSDKIRSFIESIRVGEKAGSRDQELSPATISIFSKYISKNEHQVIEVNDNIADRFKGITSQKDVLLLQANESHKMTDACDESLTRWFEMVVGALNVSEGQTIIIDISFPHGFTQDEKKAFNDAITQKLNSYKTTKELDVSFSVQDKNAQPALSATKFEDKDRGRANSV